ncbi:MAG: intradiol ring-cleavage dioxygenase [Planctomycetes bacterium]|nr:intradiol ring-cleavage dioxygenase [Planctomycetota bacterium]
MNLINPRTYERTDESRRRAVRLLALGSLFAGRAGAYAEELVRTPRVTEGPFFPDKLPLDTDNDLLVITDATELADGEVTWLSGRILDASGSPIRNALVEIWQVDAHGAYLHSRTGNAENRDRRFQGYGRFVTGTDGCYGFRTIKPVPYPGRTPHIHFTISRGGDRLLTTQCFVKGHPQNDRDGILRRIGDAAQRESLVVDFQPLEGSRIGELTARFDVVLGLTPDDA